LFALRTSICKEFIDHVRDSTLLKEVWETLERLFSKKEYSKEAFAKQMTKNFDQDVALFSKGKHNKKNTTTEKWIIDSSCSNRATGNDSLLSELRQQNGNRVIVTVDNSTYPVMNEGVAKMNDDARTR
ncbi:hypothetical protein QQP08_010999, partial [Theobroma cacao]